MNITQLMHFSWLYERDEARADVYPMVRYWIENNDSEIEKIRGIATLLYIWNIGYYSRAGKPFSAAVDNVEEVIQKNRFQKLSKVLESYDLAAIDLLKYNKEIKEIYRSVRACTGFGEAATSKFLHLINPDLFVMWDTDICSHYHKKHGKRGLRHRKGHDVCYYEFLKEMQKNAQMLLTQSSEKEIEKGLSEISGYRKTIAKALDEGNYMQITIPGKKNNYRKRNGLRFLIRE